MDMPNDRRTAGKAAWYLSLAAGLWPIAAAAAAPAETPRLAIGTNVCGAPGP